MTATETRDVILRLSRELPALLSDEHETWKPDLRNLNEGSNVWLRLYREDGAALSIHVDGWRGRVNVRGEWPTIEQRARNGIARTHTIYPRTNDTRATGGFSIGVACSKPSRTIANDIMRRVLTEYSPLYTEALRLKVASLDHAQRQLALGVELARAAGVEPPTDVERVSFALNINDGYGNVTVSGESIAVEMRGLNKETATKILKLLAEQEGRAS